MATHQTHPKILKSTRHNDNLIFNAFSVYASEPSLHFLFMWCVCACTHVYTHATVHGGRSEDNAGKLVLSFHPLGSKDAIQVIRFGSEHLYSLNHLIHLTRVLISAVYVVILQLRGKNLIPGPMRWPASEDARH